MPRNRPYIYFEKVPGTRFIGVQILSSPTRHIISLKVYGAQSSRHQDDGTTFFGYDEYMAPKVRYDEYIPLPFGMGIKSVYQFSPPFDKLRNQGFIRLVQAFTRALGDQSICTRFIAVPGLPTSV